MNDFYIGYLAKAPPRMARIVRAVALVLVVMTALLSIGLVTAQRPFAASFFEFGQVRTFRGVIETLPYPVLRVTRPGGAAGVSRYALVAPGKHGAEQIVQGFAQQQVTLQGMLIFRQGVTLIEVMPGTVRAVPYDEIGRASCRERV